MEEYKESGNDFAEPDRVQLRDPQAGSGGRIDRQAIAAAGHSVLPSTPDALRLLVL